MISKAENGIRWLEFDSFQDLPLKHGVFTRHGGVSPEPWKSLNIGGTVGDATANTRENKKRLLEALSIPIDSVFDVWQVHSADYILATKPRPVDEEHEKADIILTRVAGLTLLMRFADCVPILAYDPLHHAAGIAHAGWIGTSKDTAGSLIRAMQIEFDSIPSNIIAAIGPSICQKHYPVGDEVREIFKTVLPGKDRELFSHANGKAHLDLWKANEIQLKQCGVKQIEMADECTVCHNQDWFSHRMEQGKTGRFGALIQLL
jgi:YfiH family protein